MKRAHGELKLKIIELDISQNQAAALVECDPGNFSKILNKGTEPSVQLAARMSTVFGIDVTWWAEEISPDLFARSTQAYAKAQRKGSAA